MGKGSEISFRAHGALLTCTLDVEPELGYKYVRIWVNIASWRCDLSEL